MNAAQHINQTSGDTEYFTPKELVDAARDLMGAIDLDPFSSAAANAVVQASTFFGPIEDGFTQKWFGSVWVNHPFGRVTNPRAVAKMEKEFMSGRVTEMCCITYACTSEAWFQPLQRRPQCMLSPRTNYRLPDGTIKRGVTKGSVITYFGRDLQDFKAHFENFGIIRICA